jgi:signal transduction histidine kinase
LVFGVRFAPAVTIELLISAQAIGEEIVLAVADTGQGIRPENMCNIFQPLFTTKARGIGLGLAISKDLIESNGGRIEVDSTEGRGSTFTLTLPVV